MTEIQATNDSAAEKGSLRQTLQAATQEAREWARQYPRLGMGLLGGVMLLGAGGAFAIATPARDDVVVQHILQTVQPAVAIDTQQAALRNHHFILYRNTESRERDTAASLLARLGVSDSAAESWLRATDAVRAEALGHDRRLVLAEVLPDQRLQRLRVRWLDAEQPYRYRELQVSRTEQGFDYKIQTGKAEVQSELATVSFDGRGYFHATGAADVPATVASQLLEVFDPQVDIEKNARNGDSMALTWERLSVEGQTLGHGRLLSADAQVQGQNYRAVWFDGGRAQGGKYYAPDGRGLELAYVSPLPGGAFVTSPFVAFRLHPVLGISRPHTGVDFRASIGTPIVAVADGTVNFAGMQPGYGNVIILQHANKQSTLYAHLSGFNVSAGQHVKQGMVIGKTGNTGVSTGPHLHFETRTNDVPENPETVLAERRGSNLPVAQRAAFGKVVADAQRYWDQAHGMQLASAR